MEIQILNTWTSTPVKKIFFKERSEPIYKVGDYAIYHQYANCWLYTYKNIAVNQLAGVNKEHLNRLANNTPPEIDTPEYFLFKRAKETKQKGINLLKS